MGAMLRTCAEVAEGMAYLHARGIVHGDLTGSNVLLQSKEVRTCVRLLHNHKKAVEGHL